MRQRPGESSFFQRALRYTLEDFIHGDSRSRATFFARAITWPARKLARSIRNSPRSLRGNLSSDLSDKKARIAVVTGGGLGDVLSTSRYIESLYAATQCPIIDVFYAYKAYAEFIFADSPFVARLFPARSLDYLRSNYDAVVEVRSVVKYELIDPLRVSRFCPELHWLLDTSERHTGEYDAHYREAPRLDGDLAKRAVLRGLNRKSLLGYSGAVDIGNDDWVFISPSPSGLRIFDRTGLKPGHYITLYDGFDALNHPTVKRTTKQWPRDYWQKLVDKLSSKYPELKIVQIGGKHSTCYVGVDINLIGQTSLDEVAWLLKYSTCHIDNESGIVRLAREVGGKSVVIFGPTDPDFFGFAENVNLRPKKCGNCFWSTPDWLAKCPKGLADPECTASIEPGQVLAAVDAVIDARRQLVPRVASMKFAQYAPRGGSVGVGRQNPGVLDEASTRSFVGEAHSYVKTFEDGAQRQHELITAAIRDRVTGDTVKLALVARQEDGSAIKYCLDKLIGAQTTWFRIKNLNESGNGEVVVLSSETFKEKRDCTDELEVPTSNAVEEKDANECRYASPLNVPAGASTFDFVILAFGSSDNLQVEFTLREMLRILKPEGVFVWTFTRDNRTSNRRTSLIGALTPTQLKGMLDNLGIVLQVDGLDQLQSEPFAGTVIEVSAAVDRGR